MGIIDRAKLVVRSEMTVARMRATAAGVEAVSRAAALGAWFPAVPQALADMPGSIRESLATRRGDFSADALYELVPDEVKTKSVDVAEFLGKRDLSHIESVKHAPGRESDIANVLFERTEWNRARGSENMTALDLSRARLDNFAEGVIAGVQATTAAATQGAIAASLLELPVTTVENLILVKANERTAKEAVQRVAGDIGRRAVHGAAGTVVFTGIAIFGVPINMVAMPLAVVGGTLYVWSASGRIWRASAELRRDPRRGPLTPVHRAN